MTQTAHSHSTLRSSRPSPLASVILPESLPRSFAQTTGAAGRSVRPHSIASHWKSRVALAVFVALQFGSSASHAAVIWDGDTSTAWATAGNWDTLPSNDLTTDIATFNLPVYGGNPVFAPNAGTTSIAGISIGSDNGDMSLSTTFLSIGASGIAVAGGAGTTAIGPVKIGANQNWTNNSSSLLTLSSTVTNVGNVAPFALTINGSGAGGTTILGIVSNGGTTGTTGLTVNTTNGITTLNGANTFTGGLNIQQGTVILGNTTAAGAGLVTIGNTGTSGTLDLNGASRTINSLATGGTAANQKITNSASTAATLNYTGATTSTFGGVIENGSGGSTTALIVNKAGADLTLSGANTYTGLTTVTAGTLTISGSLAGAMTLTAGNLNINSSSALGSGTLTLNGGTIDNTSGSAVTSQINNPAISLGSAAVAFGGTKDLSLGTGTVSFTASGATLNLNGTATLSLGTLSTSAAAGTTFTVNGPGNTLGLGGYLLTTSVTNISANIGGTGNVVISGPVTNGNSSGSSLSYIGTGTLTMSGPNSYTGGTIAKNGTIKLGANNALLTTGSLTVGGNAAGLVPVFDLAGFNQTVGTLTLGGVTGSTTTSGATVTNSTGSGTLTVSAVTYSASLNNLGATISTTALNLGGVSRTFTVGDSTTAAFDLTESAPITDGNGIFDVIKAGTGTMNYTPNVTIAGTPTSTVNAGTLLLSGTVSGGNGIFDVVKAGAGTLAYNGGVTLTGTQVASVAAGTEILNGVLSGGSAALTVAGSGTLNLSNANTYTGATTLSGGTLGLSGANGSVASTTGIIANSGTTLRLDSSTSGVTGATRAASATLKGAALNVLGNSTADSVDTITGALTIDNQSAGGGAGFNTVTLTAQSGANTRLSVGSLVRVNNGVALIRGTLLGSNAISPAVAGSSNFQIIGTAPTLVGGGGATGSTISIVPWLVGGTSTSNPGSTFLTYTTTNGFRPLDTATEFASSITDGATTTDNVRLTGTTAFTSSTTMNSLIVQPTATTAISGGTLNITSGAVLVDPDNTNVTTTISSALNFGSAQGILGTATRTVNLGKISGSGGLVLYSTSGENGSWAAGANATGSDYEGDTYIFGKVDLFANGATAFLPGGSRSGDIYVTGQLSTAATNQIINGLNGTGVVTYGHSGTSTITLGGTNSNGLFSGIIGLTNNFNTILVIKTGSGTQQLTGANSFYAGSTTIRGGTLEISTLANGGATSPSSIGSSTNVASNLVLNGGTLQYNGAATSTDRLFQIGETTTGATGTLDSSGTGAVNFTNTGAIGFGTAGTTGTAQTRTLVLTGTNTGANTIAAVIGNNGAATNGNSAVSLTKSESGTWDLSGTSNYTGPTTVTGGTLEISGGISGSAALGVDNGGTLLLGGSAGDHLNDSAVLTLGTTGNAPGSGGTFNTGGLSETVGALNLSSNSTLDLGSGASVLTFALGTSSFASGTTLTIANWSGNLGGGGTDRLIFAQDMNSLLGQINFTGFGAGAAEISLGGGQYEVVAIPEPSATALFTGVALLGLSSYRGRRRSTPAR